MKRELNIFFDFLSKNEGVSIFKFNSETLQIDMDTFNAISRLAKKNNLIEVKNDRIYLTDSAKVKLASNILTIEDLL